jgi:DNA invertase Pin-like site-specific DNA recombinase
VKFIACDMPEVDRTMIKAMVIVAAKKGELISARTKEAAAAAKTCGKRWGHCPGQTRLTRKQRIKGNSRALETIRARANYFAMQLHGTLIELAAKDKTSASGIARALNERSIKTIRGHQWSAAQVQRLREQLRIR